MKKITIAFLVLASLVSVSFAQTSQTCLDLATSLSRGQQSNDVLRLQQFLAGKGFFNATATGYFGDVTFEAVMDYQESVGIPRVGVVGPLTRAAIKEETCGGTDGVSSSTSSDSSANTNVVKIMTAQGVMSNDGTVCAAGSYNGTYSCYIYATSTYTGFDLTKGKPYFTMCPGRNDNTGTCAAGSMDTPFSGAMNALVGSILKISLWGFNSSGLAYKAGEATVRIICPVGMTLTDYTCTGTATGETPPGTPCYVTGAGQTCPTTPTTNAQLSISNSSTGPWALNGSAFNIGKIYERITGLVQANSPKGCSTPAGSSACSSASSYRDFSNSEWVNNTTVQTVVDGGVFPNGSYDTYIMYPGSQPTKVGTLTLKAQTTPCYVTGAGQTCPTDPTPTPCYVTGAGQTCPPTNPTPVSAGSIAVRITNSDGTLRAGYTTVYCGDPLKSDSLITSKILNAGDSILLSRADCVAKGGMVWGSSSVNCKVGEVLSARAEQPLQIVSSVNTYSMSCAKIGSTYVAATTTNPTPPPTGTSTNPWGDGESPWEKTSSGAETNRLTVSTANSFGDTLATVTMTNGVPPYSFTGSQENVNKANAYAQCVFQGASPISCTWNNALLYLWTPIMGGCNTFTVGGPCDSSTVTINATDSLFSGVTTPSSGSPTGSISSNKSGNICYLGLNQKYCDVTITWSSSGYASLAGLRTCGLQTGKNTSYAPGCSDGEGFFPGTQGSMTFTLNSEGYTDKSKRIFAVWGKDANGKVFKAAALTINLQCQPGLYWDHSISTCISAPSATPTGAIIPQLYAGTGQPLATLTGTTCTTALSTFSSSQNYYYCPLKVSFTQSGYAAGTYFVRGCQFTTGSTPCVLDTSASATYGQVVGNSVVYLQPGKSLKMEMWGSNSLGAQYKAAVTTVQAVCPAGKTLTVNGGCI